jgi:hypothetical protein
MPIIDYLVVAAAQETGSAVLDCDSDYDRDHGVRVHLARPRRVGSLNRRPDQGVTLTRTRVDTSRLPPPPRL